jgi:quinol-cytochrome oxidoreductase complex cytochrome b subunit
MKKETAKTFRAFLVELVIYAVLVVCYFFLVLHFLGDWLHQLEVRHRYTYAGVAILLIIGQAVVLEGVTTFLLRMLRGRSE